MIDLMTYDDFESLLRGPRGEYYAGRWEYYREVIRIVDELRPERVLELGPGLMPVVKNADVMINPEEDPYGRPPRTGGTVIRFDATRKPWPVADKAYDLFIALQVWEHLDNKQSRAFREARRVARAAILSFPWLWECGQDLALLRAHDDIDEELIADWTLGVKPLKRIEIKRTGEHFSKGPRLIYFWKFD
jgi:hypothetical protein